MAGFIAKPCCLGTGHSARSGIDGLLLTGVFLTHATRMLPPRAISDPSRPADVGSKAEIETSVAKGTILGGNPTALGQSRVATNPKIAVTGKAA